MLPVISMLALAQGSPAELDLELLAVPLTTGASPATEVSNACLGDFDGDQRMDVALLLDGRLVLHPAPNVFASTVELSDSPDAYDLARVPGTPDGVAVATGTGVALWSHAEGEAPYSMTLIGTGTGYRAVASVRLAVQCIAALTMDGREIHLFDTTGAMAAPTIGLSATATDLIAVDWVAGSDEELAVVVSGNVQIFDAARARRLAVRTSSTLSGTGLIARLRPGSGSADRLAWIGGNPHGPQVLDIYWAGQPGPSSSALGPMAIGAVAGTSLDGHGMPDLLFSTVDAQELIVLPGPAFPGEDYDRSSAYSVDASGPDGSPSMNVLAGDIDQDGDPDVVQVRSGELALLENRFIAVEDHTLALYAYGTTPPASSCPLATAIYSPPAHGTTSGTLEVAVFAVDAAGSVTSVPSTAPFSKDPPTSGVTWSATADLATDGCEAGTEVYWIARWIDGAGLAGPDVVFRHAAPEEFRPVVLYDPGGGRVNGANPRHRVPFGPPRTGD